MEFADGVLIQRNAPTIAHGLLQALLLDHFWPYRKIFRFAAEPEVRTQIIERTLWFSVK
jgi:hypothetical protein